jgi:hypothetical protein
VITERKTDFGDLVNAGNVGAGRELFRISQNNVVRVFVTLQRSSAGRSSQARKRPWRPKQEDKERPPAELFAAPWCEITVPRTSRTGATRYFAGSPAICNKPADLSRMPGAGPIRVLVLHLQIQRQSFGQECPKRHT